MDGHVTPLISQRADKEKLKSGAAVLIPAEQRPRPQQQRPQPLQTQASGQNGETANTRDPTRSVFDA